jgi:hypothetical protein
MLKDSDIRLALHQTEIQRLLQDDPYSRVIDELGIFEGACRMDVAVVNGALHGYEIKSSVDNLDRLPSQQGYYNQVFDRITLVADACHITRAMQIVPPFWGLIVAERVNGAAVLNEIWPARQNFAVDPYSLCQLLWREEALLLLKKKNISNGMWNKPRSAMWRRLAKEVPIEELRSLVRDTLRWRDNWRPN